MRHPCTWYTCLDNVRGECFAGGCSRNPAPEDRKRECDDRKKGDDVANVGEEA